MASYDFGGGSSSSLSSFTQANLAGGVVGAGNRSGKEANSASGSGVTWKTVAFLLLCLFWLYCEIKSL